MNRRKRGAYLRTIQLLFETGSTRELTDGQLLERFATDHREAAELAFAVLVERHGPMVARVCRSVLVDPNDIDDAFQATFLVLVRKSRGLWVRDSIGPWLYEVASRTARFARAEAARRRGLLAKVAGTRPESQVNQDLELERVIHDEISRLPERDRAAVVLCDLGGSSYEQAATQLGWPVGTVKSRLSRARERLRDRLRRRGYDSAILIGSSSKRLTPGAVDALARLAVRSGASYAAVSGSVAQLVQGVVVAMNVMHWFKLGVMMASVATALAAGAWARPQGAEEAKNLAQAAPKTEVVKKDEANGSAPLVSVAPSKFQWQIWSVQGQIVPAESSAVTSPVEAKIVNVVNDGAAVMKGDVICKLDNAKLKDQLVEQLVVMNLAKNAYDTAKMARETAELALKAYVDGTYKLDLNTAQGEVRVARDALARAKSRRARIEMAQQRIQALANRPAATATDILAELQLADRLDDIEQEINRSTFALERAETRLVTLEKITRAKTTRELQNAVEIGRLTELAKHAAYQHEKTKADRLTTLIESCTIKAAKDGRVFLANRRNDLGGQFDAGISIQNGARVAEQQKLLYLAGPGDFVAHARFEDRFLADLKLGQAATIRFPGRGTAPDTGQPKPVKNAPLTGEVVEISPKPESAPYGTWNARIRLNPGLPPEVLPLGFVAASISGDEVQALTVPANAVLQKDMLRPEEGMVLVKNPDGSFKARQVKTGRRGKAVVEITEGLKPGETVVSNLHHDDAKRALESATGGPAQRDGFAPVQPGVRKGGVARPR